MAEARQGGSDRTGDGPRWSSPPSPRLRIRSTSFRRLRRVLLAGSAWLATSLAPSAAQSPGPEALFVVPSRLDPTGAAALAVLVGLVIFATTTAILHLSQRRRWSERDALLAAQNEELRARCDRADLLLAAEPQIVVAWGGRGAEPQIEGDLILTGHAPAPRRVLAFGSWLPSDQAQDIESALERLKTRGEAFRMTLTSIGGRVFEAEGRAVTGRAVLRVREISGDRLELMRVQERESKLAGDLGSLRTMLDALPHPVWTRDAQGRLAWVNAAYARAVESADTGDAVARGTELLDRAVRDDIERHRGPQPWRGRSAGVMAGQRRMLDIVDVTTASGSIGFAADVSEAEDMRLEMQRQMQSHARTLDQLPTAVAIFDGTRRLVFCNAAYRNLWGLADNIIELGPTDGEILDRLRNLRRLPEQADYRTWKRQLHEAYHSLETRETVWYLPDARTLRVVINPNPAGGVTYLFDDVTERFKLEMQVNALSRVQGETLDTLKEGVAVFGTDGRLKLYNPAFASIWRCEAEVLEGRPHIEAVLPACRELYPDNAAWDSVKGTVLGLDENRRVFSCRMERRDGTVVDCAAAPLPDGGTLLTFADVTASVNVERALKERNEALEKAGQLRESFVHHVSYELRSPLTNVIGFTQLLADGSVGPLNDKQREYAGHIMRSSAALMAIIDDILDLASIDTGEIALALAPVDIRETIAAAVEGVQDRIAESRIRLTVDTPPSIGRFVADGKRVRQVLFNLLSNAIGFSKEGQTVTVSAQRSGDEVVFVVRDEGIGIPPEIISRVFDRFESHTLGSRHRGVGLGLSIVRSFVELHGGRVTIDSHPGAGTTVTCVFPADGEPARVAAE
jgi:signal transduction histidine kinase